MDARVMNGTTPVAGARRLPAPVAEPLPRSMLGVWPVVIMLYALILPRQIRIDLSGLVFFPDRIVALALLPVVFYAIARGSLRFRIPDFLVLGTGAWMIASMMANYGAASGLERGGALALDLVTGYFVARIFIRTTADLQRTLILFAPGLILAGVSMMAESITRTPIVRPIFEGIFGALPIYVSGEVVGYGEAQVAQYRLGLLRAAGPFPHPILGGVFLASTLPLFFWTAIRGWPRLAGTAAAILGFFSLSSAAILALIVGAALMIYDFLQRVVEQLSWKLVIFIVGAVMLAMQVVAQGGVLFVIIRYLTLNPATGYYRTLTWEYGLNTASANPLFGIGFAGYQRPVWMLSESIDAHWLLMAIRFGYPVAFLLLALGLYAIVSPALASMRTSGLQSRTLRSLSFAIFVIFLMAFTVALSGGINGWFMILTGAAITVAAQIPPLPNPARIPSQAVAA